jgi:GNAT superfamily N-acetyltransferase
MDKYGPIAKIGYADDKPVAQLLYYPEESIPYIMKPRPGVIRINCVYNPYPEYQRKGIAKSLVKMLIEEVNKGEVFKGLGPIRHLIATPFNTGEFYPQMDFFVKLGFKKLTEEEYYYSINGTIPKPLKKPPYVNRDKDRDKAIIFYEPFCTYSPIFAHRMRERIIGICNERGVDLKIMLINAWLYPQEFIKRGYNYLIIKGNPVHSFYGTEEFDEEIRNYVKE